MVTASDQDIYPDAINGENLSTMFYYTIGPLVRELTVPKLPPFRTFFIDNFFSQYIGYV